MVYVFQRVRPAAPRSCMASTSPDSRSDRAASRQRETTFRDLTDALCQEACWRSPYSAPRASPSASTPEKLRRIESPNAPSKAFLEFSGGQRVPTFIRSATEYTRLARKYGLTPLLENYSPCTAFLARFAPAIPTTEPEYLVLAVRKRGAACAPDARNWRGRGSNRVLLGLAIPVGRRTRCSRTLGAASQHRHALRAVLPPAGCATELVRSSVRTPLRSGVDPWICQAG